MCSPDVVLIHKMRGTIGNAVYVAYSTLVIIITILQCHSLKSVG
jgi:hypothetical protein